MSGTRSAFPTKVDPRGTHADKLWDAIRKLQQAFLGVLDTTIHFVGSVGIGITPAAKLHVDQSSETAAVPVLILDQADVSEEFIDFIATAAADAVNPISTWTTGNTIQGFVRASVNGTPRYFPFYDAPTS